MSVNSAAVLRLTGRGSGPIAGASRGRSTSRGRGKNQDGGALWGHGSLDQFGSVGLNKSEPFSPCFGPNQPRTWLIQLCGVGPLTPLSPRGCFQAGGEETAAFTKEVSTMWRVLVVAGERCTVPRAGKKGSQQPCTCCPPKLRFHLTSLFPQGRQKVREARAEGARLVSGCSCWHDQCVTCTFTYQLLPCVQPTRRRDISR